ncbi:MAG: rhomboid family intramembrane serine protease [Bacteroidales bacterium]
MESALIIIIAVTGIVSYMTWQKEELFKKFMFNPYAVIHKKQYFRIITHAFLHGSWLHLIINMLVLYSFGRVVLLFFQNHDAFSSMPLFHFLVLYFGSIVFSSLYTLAKHKDNPDYNSVGASGAVSAVIFTSIFFIPWHPVYLFAIIPVPGIVFGALYLVYSWHMSKKGQDNIGHDAHFWGAVFGFAYPLMVSPELIQEFFSKLLAVNIG